jgi:hypothetical protein
MSSVVLLVALAVAGCKKSSPTPQAQANAPGAPGAPGAEMAAPATLTGTVVERLEAPPYSYLKLKTAQGEAWAAVPKTDVANGQQVSIAGPMPMQNFESKTLKRKFDLVYFGTIAGPNGAAPAGMGAGGMPPGAMGGMPPAGAGGMPPGMGGGAMGGGMEGSSSVAAAHAAVGSGPDVGDVKVEKAKGADAHTVGEVWAQKAALKEKPVIVRGKVVKYNEGIMGRNWLHLRDGSGKQGQNDLTVTTTDKAAVGDVVTAKGTVRTDKDFGAGYAYPVIVEDATLSK